MKKIARNLIGCLTMFSVVTAVFGDCGVLASQKMTTEAQIVTSAELGCRGYQIKVTEKQDGVGDVGFRAICYAPNIGSTITVGQKQYTIAEIGTIYVLDPDCSGVESDRVLGRDYTILDPGSRVNDGGLIRYSGANKYNGMRYAHGFIATEEGTNVSYKDDDGIDNTNYIRTITEVNNLIANTMQVRAFAVATDGTIIYSETVSTLSVARVASIIYEKSLSQSVAEHKNIYKYILNSSLLADLYMQNNQYPYYRETEIKYDDWSPVVKP